MDRTILHCDCNGFYASVECVLRPELKKIPMAVCGDPENRHGVILAKNELAKRFGVQTAETIWQAKQKCPSLTLISPHRDLYAKYSKEINQVYEQYTDLVEPFGIDESWLDVTESTGLFGTGRQIADTLRRRIYQEFGLTISVGVSFNKIFAKLGSDYKKPDATTVISRKNFQALLFPLPVSALLFVGNSTEAVLNKLKIRTIGDLASGNRTLLTKHLGKMGGQLYDYANGLDDSPVESAYAKKEIKSVGNGITFRRNLVGWDDIRTGVTALADTVAARLRKQQVKCCGVQVTLKDIKLKTISRQQMLSQPTHLSKVITDAALQIIRRSWKISNPIRMITITGIQLVTDDQSGMQLSLFEDVKKYDRREQLEAAIDMLRDKYGKSVISYGSILKNDLGIEDHSKAEKENPQ